LCDLILETLIQNKPSDDPKLQSPEDHEALKAMNDVLNSVEKENLELKAALSNVNSQLRKEQLKTKEIIPQYRDSVNRLKKNTILLRDKVKEMQELRVSDHNEYANKVLTLIKYQFIVESSGGIEEEGFE
jgi:hypothetical protein